MLFDNKTIFNALAEQYNAYRPHYPPQALLFLVTLGELDRTSDVADIGTGTGRIALELAKYVRLVYAVDTANVMLDQLQITAEEEGLSNIRTIEAPGEATGLQSESLDLVSLAQAFHWMDKPSALKEASRILKPEKSLVLLWNQVTNTKDDYYSEIVGLIKKYNPHYKGGADILSADFADHINASHLFSPPERYTFSFEAIYSPENYIGFLLSKSYIGVGIGSSDLPHFIEGSYLVLKDAFPDGNVVEKYETVMLAARKKD
ncbi:MAG: class I SAM-dependent methyltransferase [Bacteroidota bacterium]|nr:class I SAM-dependent methyltransferase [Bacteroidota bacterium]MDP4229915.1 class I SAM-dependent methyltransferase [Bacteroidota bacterium]MDP4235585.1 class I SAM-dependent methyltransferase [Bacteroidota bacterium]